MDSDLGIFKPVRTASRPFGLRHLPIGLFFEPPQKWAQFLFPVNPIDPASGETRPLNDCLANGVYLGPWAFFLMGFAFKGPRRKLAWHIAAAGLAVLILIFGKFFPLHRWACLLLPGIGLSRAHYRYVLLYAMAGAILAALGHETMGEWIEKNGKKKIIGLLWGTAAYSFLLALSGRGQGPSILFQLALILAVPCGVFGLYLWRGRRIFERSGKWLFLLSMVLCAFSHGVGGLAPAGGVRRPILITPPVAGPWPN